MTVLSIAAVPTERRWFAAKVAVLAAGSAVAGAALFGGVAAGPLLPGTSFANVQHDVALVALVDAPTFVQSLQSVFDALHVGNMGDVLGLVGTGLNTESPLSGLLAALNPGPNPLSLDAITGGLLGSDVGAILQQFGLADTSIDSLVGGLLGGTGADASLYDIATALGLGQFAGLVNALDICTFGETCGLLQSGTTLTDNSSMSDWLSAMLKIDTNTASLGQLALGNGTLGDAPLNSLLGISDAQLAQPWDQFVSALPTGGGLLDPEGTGTLGQESLGALLTSLTGGAAVTDTTTLTDFLGDIGLLGTV